VYPLRVERYRSPAKVIGRFPSDTADSNHRSTVSNLPDSRRWPVSRDRLEMAESRQSSLNQTYALSTTKECSWPEADLPAPWTTCECFGNFILFA
jgi:hypothetical protein